MKTPRQSQALYVKLKAAILRGELLPDTPLPEERQMAGAHQVARGTLRRALAQLEADGLIRRVRGHGTFVNAKTDGDIITYLVACPDFSAMGIGNATLARCQLHGIMREARKFHCRVETLPVSAVNVPDRIDFLNLNHLRENSMVIVSGIWFRYVYEFLGRRKCRVCLDHEQSAEIGQYRDWLTDWIKIENDVAAAAVIGMDTLRKRGCRSILFYSYREGESTHAVRGKYLEQCRIHGLTPRILEVDFRDFSAAGLAECCREWQIDGVLNNFDWDVSDKKFEDRPFGELHDRVDFFSIVPPVRQSYFAENFQGAIFDKTEIGSLGVRSLLQGGTTGQTILNPPVIVKAPVGN